MAVCIVYVEKVRLAQEWRHIWTGNCMCALSDECYTDVCGLR